MRLRAMVKMLVLGAYVFLWVPLRNAFRAVCGQCHVTILMYHRVSDEFSDGVTVGVEQFRRQIRLAKHRYPILDMTEIVSRRGQARRRPAVALTFDDGYADNYAAAAFLRDEGISAVFFLSTRIVGSARAFPHDLRRLGRRVESLGWEQVREIASWGHHIASHTADHPNLAELDETAALEQVRLGQEDLDARFGARSAREWFAYPHGRREDLPAVVRDRLDECGIKFCFSAYGGVNLPGFAPDDIRRQGIDGGFDTLAFLAALEGWRVRVPARSGARTPSQGTAKGDL